MLLSAVHVDAESRMHSFCAAPEAHGCEGVLTSAVPLEAR